MLGGSYTCKQNEQTKFICCFEESSFYIVLFQEHFQVFDSSLNELKSVRVSDCLERLELVRLSMSCGTKAITQNCYYIGFGEIEISQDSDFGGIP